MTNSLAQWVSRVSQWPRAFMQLGWPNQLACVLVAAAMVTSACAWFIAQHAHNLAAMLESVQGTQVAPPMKLEPVDEALSMAPQDAQYIQDLGLLFQIGQEAGVALGVMEYKSETNPKAPLTVRTIELRTNEDYPKIKGFISKVLNEMPHAALQEIRIERKDAQTAQGSMLIKLSLVYQARQ